jgi:hypothetical protein
MNKQDLHPRQVVLDLVLKWAERIGTAGTATVRDGAMTYAARNHRGEFTMSSVDVHFVGEPSSESPPRFVLYKLHPTVWKLSPSVVTDQLHAYLTIVGVPDPAPWESVADRETAFLRQYMERYCVCGRPRREHAHFYQHAWKAGANSDLGNWATGLQVLAVTGSCGGFLDAIELRLGGKPMENPLLSALYGRPEESNVETDPTQFVLFILDLGDGRHIGIGDPKLWPKHRVVFSDKGLLDRLSHDEINARLASTEDSEAIIKDFEQRLLKPSEAS